MKLQTPNFKLQELPEWRRVAPAGLSLARAAAALPDKSGALVPNGDQTREVQGALQRILRPEAAARWILPSLAMITPAYVEAILRGALVGNHVFQWQLFDLMEDTWPRLVKNLNELKRAAIRELTQKWELRAWAGRDEAAKPEAEARAATVEEALNFSGDPKRNINGYQDTLYDVLDAWAKGSSVLEILWGNRKSGDGGELIAPEGTVWTHPKNYGWGSGGEMGLILPEANGDVASPWANTALRMGEHGQLAEIPDDKFLCAICRARSGHPLGGALLRPLAWWWCAGNFSADWLLDFAQIFGLPIRWANYAPSATKETIDAICDMLANIGQAGWGAFPAGTTVELKEAAKSGNEVPQALMLDRVDKQCDLLILGQTLTTEVRREGGARALGEVHADVRDDVIHATAGFAARVINDQLIKAVLRLNYGDDEMAPRLMPPEDDPKAAKSNAEVLEIAVAMGVPVPTDFALEKLNIPRAEEGEEILKPQIPNSNPGSDKPGGLPDGSKLEACATHARSAATDKLVGQVLEELTGVEARWLGGVRPFFRSLVLKAQSEHVTDAEFVTALERAQRELPELFAKLDHGALARSLERAMGSAVVNGAVRGAMKRGAGKSGRGLPHSMTLREGGGA